MKKNNLLFYEYIYECVEYFRLDRGLKLKDLAHSLNVSEQFLKQIQQKKSHYNLEHLFILAEEYEYPINLFFPDEEIYSKIENKKFSSEYTYEELIEAFINELKYERGKL